MLIVNSDALKTFLNRNLSKFNSDVEPLTKYIMALLKKNLPLSELRDLLVDQLDIFLRKDTPAFVDLLLRALNTKCYLNTEDGLEKADSSLASGTTASSKNGVPDVLKKNKPERESNSKIGCHSTNSDVASAEHESSRPSKRIRRNDLPPTEVSEACSIFQSTSREREKVDMVDPPSHTINASNSINADYRPLKSTNYIKRCSDYDQRGYCLMGSNCLFAHGCDAIPLNMEDVSSLNLQLNVSPEDPFEDGSSHTTGTRSISPLPPPPLPTTSPPPLPPLPPPSMLDAALASVLEPYNPESPGMTTYYSTSLGMGPTLPPSGPGICSSMYGVRNNETFHSKPQRARELIGVPTVNSVSPRELNNENFGERETTTVLKRKGTFDFSRLGPPKKLAQESILELRKVPRHLNTIARLNSHFSKFGRIINLEISFDNDPEAALVKFASPSEASNAYRSSVAIFNNRFIKVFYHRSNGANPLSVEKIEKSSVGVCEAKDTSFDKMTPQEERAKYASTHISKGNVSRTVFIPNHKFFPENTHNKNIKGEEPPTHKKHPSFQKELELLRKKQGFLKDSIDHQKVILAKLMKSKNKKEAEFLKKTIETISSNIGSLKTEIKKESDDLKKKLAGKKASIVNKSEKEVLDAEMDLYRERQKNKEKRAEKILSPHTETKETANLLTQVKELKEKAKSLGLIDGSVPPHGGVGSRHAKFKKHSIHGISCPKQILVCGPIKDERDLLKHFEQFGNVENIEDRNPYNLVTFSSRAEAEAAFLHGSKFDGTALNLVWFQDPQYSTIQNTDSSESKPINPDIVGDDEEEEEDDEDSEARSWRR